MQISLSTYTVSVSKRVGSSKLRAIHVDTTSIRHTFGMVELEFLNLSPASISLKIK